MKFKERNYTEISEADQRPLERGQERGGPPRSWRPARLGLRLGGQRRSWPPPRAEAERKSGVGSCPVLLCVPVMGSTCACGCCVPVGHGPLHRAEVTPLLLAPGGGPEALGVG